MPDKAPTQEQIKEFWERCGLQEITYQMCECHPRRLGHYWHDPTGDYIPDMPGIDLNNLFKYAVPKLYEGFGLRVENTLKNWIETIILRDMLYQPKAQTLALFWAIWEVIHKESWYES